MNQLPKRSEVPVSYTWDLSHLFENQASYLEAVEKVKADARQFKENFGGKLSSVETIFEALEKYESILIDQSNVGMYGSLGFETDKTNPEYEENKSKLDGLHAVVGSNLAFFAPELSNVNANLLEEVLSHPQGGKFQYFLKELGRNKEHQLSVELEEMLSALSGTFGGFYSIYGAMKFQDMTFEDFEVNGKTYTNSFVTFEGEYEWHLDQDIRLAAWKSFHEGLRRYQHTAATNYLKEVQTQKTIATARGFDSVFDALLFNQKVTKEAYNRQIDLIMTEFAPVMRRYAKLLKEEQGLETLGLADIKMPFTKVEAEYISIENARQLMVDIFQIFGEEYLSVIKRSFDERWIDFPMNQTKSTGGFCASAYQGPSYILINWTGQLSEALVLAHELGHAGHFNLTYKNQLMMTPEVSLYFVEAPSTANEVIACQYLLKQPINNVQKRVLISEFISRTYFHNMVTHLLEADFQRKVYQAIDQAELLNAERLNQFFLETLQNFWGDALEITPGAELTWMRQPHYFIGLYPYTYSAGLTIGTQIGQRVAKGDPEAIESWLTVLKAGGTMSPLDLAKTAGVSMENADALRSAIQYVDGLLDQIEALKA